MPPAPESSTVGDARLAAERAARASYGRLLALLVSRTGDIAAAEDALSDAFARALEVWPAQGVPANPDAWLLTAARRITIDAMRHARVERRAFADVAAIEALQPPAQEDTVIDQRLSMLFLCAHPQIDPAVRMPLMLQTVMGLEARRIAAALLVPPATLAQRLVRAKARIRDAKLVFEMPGAAGLADRVDDVLQCVYAAFTAGLDNDALGDRPGELADEAAWLGQELCSLCPNDPEVLGLAALMLYNLARRPARRGPDGAFVRLSDQDPRLWDERSIKRAETLLGAASRLGRIGRFQLEAAIQSAHVIRRLTGRTDWPAIVRLYDALVAMTSGIGARVARAAAIAEARGAAEGLKALSDIDHARIETYQPYWATFAHLSKLSGSVEAARSAFHRAAGLAEDEAVRRFLLGQAAALDAEGNDAPPQG